MVSESKKRANAKSDAKNTKQYKLKLTIATDADIIAKLESVDNKNGYLKELIRKDIQS